MQFITISGRIGGDAETRNAGDGTVTSFNLASDQGFGDRKTTNWFRISAWGKKGAGAAPYLLKGGVVTVVGELEIGEYNGKSQYNIRASDFTLPPKEKTQSSSNDTHSSDYRGNSGSGRSQADSYGGSSSIQSGFSDDLDDEVPF